MHGDDGGSAMQHPAPENVDPIADDELLYRRILQAEGWYDPQTGHIERYAFRPNKPDVTGLSLGRSKYRTASDEGALGRQGKQYFVAVLEARSIREEGLTVVPAPTDDDPGHAEISELRYPDRKSNFVIEATSRLVKRVIRVEGPFAGRRTPS